MDRRSCICLSSYPPRLCSNGQLAHLMRDPFCHILTRLAPVPASAQAVVPAAGHEAAMSPSGSLSPLWYCSYTHTVYRCQATVGVCGLGQPPDGHWSSLALSSYPACFIRGYVPHVGNVSGERSLALALQLAGWIYLWFCPLVIGIYCFRNKR